LKHAIGVGHSWAWSARDKLDLHQAKVNKDSGACPAAVARVISHHMLLECHP